MLPNGPDKSESPGRHSMNWTRRWLSIGSAMAIAVAVPPRGATPGDAVTGEIALYKHHQRVGAQTWTRPEGTRSTQGDVGIGHRKKVRDQDCRHHGRAGGMPQGSGARNERCSGAGGRGCEERRKALPAR